jgi:hypothetical protein
LDREECGTGDGTLLGAESGWMKGRSVDLTPNA